MNIYNDEEKYWFSNGGKMENIFSVKDRQEVFDFVLNLVKKHNKIVSLVQVGSGAFGYNDNRSDLDFVIALDTNDSMLEVMEYVSQKIKEKYNVIFFSQQENRHLQCFVLSNLLEFIGVDKETADSDACKIEHSISDKSFQCLKEFFLKISK